MIYNRTINDVKEAQKLIFEKVQKSIDLTSEEIQILEKGTLTANTINRIEEKTREIKELLLQSGYSVKKIETKVWDFSDVFFVEDLERILENIKILRNSFYTYPNTPSQPKAEYHFDAINKIEKILYDIDSLLKDAISNYRYCGTFQCGESA